MGKTGHLTQSEITEIVSKSGYFKFDNSTFIETGTYKGDSTAEAAKLFPNIHTIEINETLYNELNRDNIQSNNAHFHFGDSVEFLPKIAKEVNENYNFWFLDAHQSGPDTSNNGQHVPLLRELEAILENKKNVSTDIFVIDDVRLFSKYWDWDHVSITSITDIFDKYNVEIADMKIANDRLVLFPKN